jgi:hypothetical protein
VVSWRGAAVVVAGLAVAVPAIAAGDQHFQTPSHKIVCGEFPTGGPGAFLRCDLLFLNDRAAFLRRTGRGRISHVTDAVGVPGAAELPYGTTRHFGPFTCTSRVSGLTCRSPAGHGFSVSRQRRRVF